MPRPDLAPDFDITGAFDRALNIFGESTKIALLYYLETSHHITYSNLNKISLEELELALKQIVGVGAGVVIASIYEEINRQLSISTFLKSRSHLITDV